MYYCTMYFKVIPIDVKTLSYSLLLIIALIVIDSVILIASLSILAFK